MNRKLSLAVIVIFLLALTLPFGVLAHPSECAHSHGNVAAGQDTLQPYYTSTCPTCGTIGRAIGKDAWSGRIMFECKYGHRWTQ